MQTVKQVYSWDPKQRLYAILDLNYFGFLVLCITILLWIGIWAVIAFVLTDAGKHLQLALDSDSIFVFTIAATVVWIISFLIYHTLFRNLPRVKCRLSVLCYHLIRWPYFVLLLLINEPLAWSFAFAFELVIVPSAVALIFFIAWIHDCGVEIRKELNSC